MEKKPGRRAAARIDVKHRDSAACHMICVNDDAPLDFVYIRELFQLKVYVLTVIRWK